MQTGQVAFLDSALERGPFRWVQSAVVISVLGCEVCIYAGNMGEQPFSTWLNSSWRRVSWNLQRAIGDGVGDGFFLRRVELAVLVRVERRELRECIAEMFRR